MLGSAVLLLVILIGRGNGMGIYTDSQTLIFYWVVVACMFLSRMIADGARRDARDQANRPRRRWNNLSARPRIWHGRPAIYPNRTRGSSSSWIS